MKTKNLLSCLFGVTSFLLTGIGFSLSNLTAVSINRDNTIEIKRLTSSSDPEGHVTYTFSYNVMPATATDMTCAMSLAYADGADCSQVVTGILDPEQKTISVTNLAPFDKQIILTINSVADPSIKSTVTIDYEKKILSATNVDITISDGWQGFRYDLWNALDVQYSIYTIDKEYPFTLDFAKANRSSETCFSVSDESLKNKYVDLLYDINSQMGDRFTDPISVTQSAINDEDFSASKWLLMGSALENNQWANFLADVVTNKAKIVVEATFGFCGPNAYGVSNPSKVSFDLSAMGYSVSDFYTAVTSVESESSSLVF